MKTQKRQRVQAFKLDQRGLARVFGELEAQIMDAVWVLGEARVADVCEWFDGAANYKTVMTVMNRLVEKRVLLRERQSRAFVYTPVESRDVFLGRVSQRVVEGLVRDFGDVAVAQFVDALDAVDPALLERLQKLVNERASRDEADT